MTTPPSDEKQPPPAESIGRPGPWKEGRYEQRDTPPGESVVRKPGEGPVDTVSSTVTLDDYEQKST